MRPDPAGPARGVHQARRMSRFDAREVFPEPAKRGTADPAATAAHGGEIALYGEIERRLRKRGIAEPARDLETLKQILEALQLKGLLHHHPHHSPPPPPSPPSASFRTPPPIVLMRPAHRAPQQPARGCQPARRLLVDVDPARRRSQSPERAASPARSPASPARRGGPQSPQRMRVSSAQSPKQQHPQPSFRKSVFDAAGARSRIARRAAQNSGLLLSPDEAEASTTFSDGGSSSSFSASSRWDFEPPTPVVLGDETTRKLERCGKLLSSIQAFTGVDASAADQQPSPVSVLDAAAFLADADSPSSSSGSNSKRRTIDFNVIAPKAGGPGPAVATTLSSSDPEDDEWALVGSSPDPDYAYVAELIRLFRRARDDSAAEVYRVAEQRRRLRTPAGTGEEEEDACQHRRLLCGAVAEVLDRQRSACPWDPASRLRGAELVGHVWAEVRRARDAPAGDEDDLGAIRRDLYAAAEDGPWAAAASRGRAASGPEVADALLQIERLVFKDLVADTIRELADADRLLPPPRRKLVF